MSESLFQFDWPVDAAGYDILPPEVSFEEMMKTADSLLGDGRRTTHDVRRKGGPLRYYRPLEDHPALFRQFGSDVTDYESLRGFLDQFGLLTESGFDSMRSSLSGEECLQWAGFMRTVAQLIDDGDRLGAIKLFNENRLTVRLNPKISTSTSGRAKLEVLPTSLVGAMMVQLAGALTEGTKFRRCKHCGKWFPFGPGTPNSIRKEFCADKCRVASMRRRQAGDAVGAGE